MSRLRGDGMAIPNLNHTQISNYFIDECMRDVSESATKVFVALSRKTIGWHKETDSVSVSQIMSITGLSNRVVIKAVRELEEKELVVVDRFSGRSNTFTLNYTSDEKSQVKDIPVTKSHTTSDEKSQVPMTKSHTQKKDKETNKRNICEFPQKTPTLEDVKKYVEEKGYNVDPVKFHEFYSAGNWHDSRGNKVKNWKQKLITWHHKNPSPQNNNETMEERLARIDRMKASGEWK